MNPITSALTRITPLIRGFSLMAVLIAPVTPSLLAGIPVSQLPRAGMNLSTNAYWAIVSVRPASLGDDLPRSVR